MSQSGSFPLITSLPITVPDGGTGVVAITDHALVVGSGVAPITVLAAATDGQLCIGSTGADPAIADLTSTNGTITVAAGAGTLDLSAGPSLLTPTGFAGWGGAGNYFDDTTLGEFEVLRSGTGYIKGVPISWAGSQTVTGMTAGNTYLIYMDNAGTIGKTTTFSQATFEDYIVLFECLRDSTAGTNNQVTVKENHPYDFQVAVSYWAHETVGVVIENHAGGANITLNGTVKIQINGTDELSDHGLYTDIPDSGGVGEVFNQYFTLGSGKWARYLQSDTFDGTWDSAGTATALGANKFAVTTLYLSKDNITAATPVYFAVLDTSQYNNLVSARTAIANGSTAVTSGELANLEIARLGYIIFSESSGTIVDVIINKETISSGSTTSGTNIASLVITSTTNFDGILSVADTNVQAALETIDDWGKTATDHGVLIGQGVNTPVVAQVLTDGQLIVGSTGIDPVAATITAGAGINVANGAGTITISNTGSGGISWSVIVADLDPMVVDNGYICNKAGLLTLTLPATSVLGSILSVTGMNTDAGWLIEQLANQIIHFGGTSTTTGVGGSLASTLKRDSVELVCVVADLEWNVISSVGNITIV